MGHPKIVLTSDRTLMSPYRGISLATFFGCAPALDPNRDKKSFWYKMHFGDMPYQHLNDGTKIKDLYQVTVNAFSDPLYTFFYVFKFFFISKFS